MTTTTTSSTKTINVAGVGPVDLTVEKRGDGRPYLVLHGGAGPQSVSEFARLLAEKDHNRVLAPTHPGFGGTTRPEALDSVAKLADLYGGLID
jgi:pimeloyl-ACP methyl ester carboxylesterase